MKTIWQVSFGEAKGPPVRILRLDIDYVVNREALVRLHLASELPPSLFLGQTLILVVRESGEGRTIHKLRLHLVSLADESSHVVVVARSSPLAPTSPRERPQVVQRAADEPVTDFVNRLGLGATFSPPGGRDGLVGALEDVMPVGSCVILEPGQDAATLVARFFDRITHRRPAIAGWFKGITDKFRHWCAHHPGANDPNFYMELDPDAWNLVASRESSADPEDACFSYSFPHDAPESVFKELTTAKATPARLKVGNLEIPLRPTTVRIRKHDSFVFRVRLTFSVDSEAAANHDIEVRLLLRTSAAGLSASPGPETTNLILGRFISWHADGGRTRMVAVKPAEAGDITDAELRPLANWEFAPGGGAPHLLAPLLAPGFVREAHSAFYSAWKPGDLLLLSIAQGQLPVALGAVQRMRVGIPGEGGLEVALAGTGVRLDAVTADGSSGGNAIEVGSNSMSIESGGTATIKGGTIGLEGEVKVKGKMTIS